MTAPTRRRFRWSLRTMFVVVTVFGCLAGCFTAFPLASAIVAVLAASISLWMAITVLVAHAIANLIDRAQGRR